MIARNHYDDETLNRLLLDRLGESDGEVARHVEFCETCQMRMESISQDGMTWEEVSRMLLPEDELNALQSTVPSADESSHLRQSTKGFLEPSDHPDSLGRFARYEIMELLGRGGMGIVMRGYDTQLNRNSAIKVLAPELASSAAARRRFFREAKSAAAVVHPHVVPIQTVDEHSGLPYLVMPVVEGQSLQHRVDQEGPLRIVEAVRIAAQVAEGLSAAHEQGLVHRDIKPANVLLENGLERVQITDFGLARAIDDASMTRSGVIAGTPQYMSPEQA
ncbi:MAG: serine/threonine protein kinase, partial [Planctomycetales bacterium]|nr:serine/threonine protein kinase [Planctomycetales bacterium]